MEHDDYYRHLLKHFMYDICIIYKLSNINSFDHLTYNPIGEKNSTQYFSYELSGLMKHFQNIHYGRALKVTEAETEPEPLYMESFYLCFILYFIGLLTGKFK